MISVLDVIYGGFFFLEMNIKANFEGEGVRNMQCKKIEVSRGVEGRVAAKSLAIIARLFGSFKPLKGFGGSVGLTVWGLKGCTFTV